MKVSDIAHLYSRMMILIPGHYITILDGVVHDVCGDTYNHERAIAYWYKPEYKL